MDKKLMHVDSGSTAVSAIRIIVSSAGNLRLECLLVVSTLKTNLSIGIIIPSPNAWKKEPDGTCLRPPTTVITSAFFV